MFVLDDLIALDKAISAGTLSVRHGDSSVQYGTFDDLVKRRAFIADWLAANGQATGEGGASAGKPYARRAVARYNSGLR